MGNIRVDIVTDIPRRAARNRELIQPGVIRDPRLLGSGDRVIDDGGIVIGHRICGVEHIGDSRDLQAKDLAGCLLFCRAGSSRFSGNNRVSGVNRLTLWSARVFKAKERGSHAQQTLLALLIRLIVTLRIACLGPGIILSLFSLGGCVLARRGWATAAG